MISSLKKLQENWEKTIKNIKIPKSINETTINNKNPTNQQTELGTSAISPSVTSIQEDSSEKADYGTEKVLTKLIVHSISKLVLVDMAIHVVDITSTLKKALLF